MLNVIVGRVDGAYAVEFGRFRCHFVCFVYGFVHPDQVIMHFVREISAFHREVRTFHLGIYTVRLKVGLEALM